MVDIHNLIELRLYEEPERDSQALARTAQAALEDLADQHQQEGATQAETTSYLVHLAITAARNIAP